jgi:predicted nucleic acid-binding protein
VSSVVDASVAVKWVVNEELTTQARALLARSVRDRTPLLAPPHLPGEVANALYRRSLRSDNQVVSPEVAEEALAEFLTFPLLLLAPEHLYLDALRFARIHQVGSIYDALYVVLARRAGVEFWTADQRLLTSLGSSAPWVRWLGDFPV